MTIAKPFWKPGETGVVSWKTGENSWCVAASINFVPKTTVVNIRDTKDFDVYVGRKNKEFGQEKYIYSNPFILASYKYDREKVYNHYERWLKFQYRSQENYEMDWQLDFLQGKKLACFCAPKKCHADLLAKLADMTYEERWEWANDNS